MAHTTLGWSSYPCYKPNNWLLLFIVISDPIGGHLLSLSSDLPNHYDSLSLRVKHKSLQDINEVGSIERISSNPNNCGLPKACFSSLINSLVCESS